MADYVSRLTAADHLSQRLGRKVTPGALEKLAERGLGPPYRIILGRCAYRAADLDAWLESVAEAPKKRSKRRRPLTRKGAGRPGPSARAVSSPAVPA